MTTVDLNLNSFQQKEILDGCFRRISRGVQEGDDEVTPKGDIEHVIELEVGKGL